MALLVAESEALALEAVLSVKVGLRLVPNGPWHRSGGVQMSAQGRGLRVATGMAALST